MKVKKINVSVVKDKHINNPSNCVKIARSLINEEDFNKEHLIVMYLNSKNIVKSAEVVHTVKSAEVVHTVKSAEVVHIGDINSCIVSPSNVFKSAIINDCNSIIILHNHPSGDLEPSVGDRDIFENLKKGGKILKIRVLDSIIFNKKGESYSLLFRRYEK